MCKVSHIPSHCVCVCVCACTHVAGGKGEGAEHNGTDASLVMTLEINQVIYQGVLFAKPPSSSSPQR